MRILVAIANYGTKNQRYLDRLIHEYQSMSFDVHIVVLSNIPKDVGPDVEVQVGLPTKDPWSLPFGHQKIFAERCDDYDLFIYSEDDTLVTQRNIEAFLDATAVLGPDDIAGFLRYEQDSQGHRYCSTIHAHYHWQPDSVMVKGDYCFAYCTNEHAACYMVTRDQLHRVIDTGKYLVGPDYDAPYDLLCAAATNPYTQCGLRKLVPISHMDDFLLHHMPNQYLGRMGLPLEELERQAKALLKHGRGELGGLQLFGGVTKLEKRTWDKDYYEHPRDDVLVAVPGEAEHILSIGCGWAATEKALIERGACVTAMPMDAIVAESAMVRGVTCLPPDFSSAFEAITPGSFDAILLIHVLQYLPEPDTLLRECKRVLKDTGCVVIIAPNFQYLRHRRDRALRPWLGHRAESFEPLGFHLTDIRSLKQWISAGSLTTEKVWPEVSPKWAPLAKALMGYGDRFLSPEVLVIAK